MAVPALPGDDSDGNDWTAAKVNAIYDHVQWWRDTRPLFKGSGYTDNGGSQLEVSTATNTTIGFGSGGSFATAPEINIGSWTVQASDADPESLVVPESGIYMISHVVEWEGNSTGLRFSQVVVGATPQTETKSTTSPDTVTNAGTGSTSYFDLASGAQLDLQVWQNSGTTIDAVGWITALWIQST